ncbi:MAG: DNA repair protein RecN [Alphaproteobacteria bacterium 16-39-46]|nr:MAG: DNA repair protein RecN [Alphaproteobacteria bacterium 16-39-46]OZA44536.1 MAG: DNA repair protein RecN [Alphaproteobacteria bacterium 17-39-52]HQS83384.1 DNA repair protein RecN [Alphaproteobacteria bacterium]HQS93071.1 DNA repair protein RecN [Alphaproteobacteria bacterium]
MLKSLSIHNFILIESLHLDFEKGFTVFTGETGAGKSILLDALSFALGGRAEASLIGPHKEKAQVVAEFLLPLNHPAFGILEEQGLFNSEDLPHLILRRSLERDGKSRAFLNDTPVKSTLLKTLASLLLEIHGQFDRLLEAPEHRNFLDIFGNLRAYCQKTEEAFKDWRDTESALRDLLSSEKTARETYDIWGHHLEELKAFDPQSNEEESLLLEREKISSQSKFQKALEEALHIFESAPSLETQFLSHHKNLSRYEERYPDLLPLLEGFDRILVDVRESQMLLEKIQRTCLSDPHRLELIEDRLSELRTLARKHQVPPSELREILAILLQKFSTFETQSLEIKSLEEQTLKKRTFYEECVKSLSQERLKVAHTLEELVQKELPLLKLERTLFKVVLKTLPPDSWTAQGGETIEFEISPNGGRFGSLKAIASGGELARILLALKVALAGRHDISVIIFDEIDSGVSGAVSSSIGNCLHKLSKNVQVMAITHAPQVASAADHHFLIEKTFENNLPQTRALLLDETSRSAEIARMLSGEEVTIEAHAAAHRLLKG